MFPYSRFPTSPDYGCWLESATQTRHSNSGSSKRTDASKCSTSNVVVKGEGSCLTLPRLRQIYSCTLCVASQQKSVTLAAAASCTKSGDAKALSSALHSSSASVRAGCRNRAVLPGEARHVEHTAACRAVERERRFQPARGELDKRERKGLAFCVC